MRRYILNDDHTTRPAEPGEPEDWRDWSIERRRVAVSTVAGYEVSTVFLGIDHNFMAEGPPLLFETMVFGEGRHDLDCRRWSTWDQAVEGHAEVMAELLADLDSGDTLPLRTRGGDA